MRRIAKIGGFGVAGLLVLLVTALAGFRFASMQRETLPPGVATSETGSFADVGGLRIHYRTWGDPGGAPLLLIPGTLAWSGTWIDIAPSLADAGYHVIAPDLPPFGFSQRPDADGYSRTAQSERILAFADALGLGSFHLAGHSFGGGATVETAFTAPDRVESLVLLDVALGLGSSSAGPPAAPLFALEPVRNAITAATLTNPMFLGKGLRDFIHDDSIVTPQRITIYRKQFDVAGTTAAVGDWFVNGLFGDERNSLAANRDNYRGFDKPALVIWGREDTVTPLAQGEEIADLLPQSRLVILDNVNHIPHVEAPRAVSDAMIAFLDGLAPVQPPLQAQSPDIAVLAGMELRGSLD